MNISTERIRAREPRHATTLAWIALTALSAFATLVNFAYAAAPPAGTTIGNQASATYTDDSLVTRTVTSNTVVTIVQQVASVTLNQSGTRTVAPGGQVAFPHTVTNGGNGTDSFLLTAVPTGTLVFSSVQILPDANGDGVPDSSTPIASTGELAAGAVFHFVVVGTVPGAAVAGTSNATLVTATSVFTPAMNATNTDSTTVTSQAVMVVTQALDIIAGPSPAGPRTLTLTYTNTGNSTATNVTFTEPLPAGMTYVANSARWSSTGSTVLTDGNSADNQSGIVYDFGDTVANRITAVIASIPAGTSGTLRFQVNIAANLPPGAHPATAVTANFAYNDGSGPVAARPTNIVQYTVTQVAAVAVSSVTVPTAAQGATVEFTNVVTNNGNGADTFNLSLGSSTFPIGTTFQLYHADGATPLTDSNGDGIPDTGSFAGSGGTFSLRVKAVLPPGIAGGGAYAVHLTARSIADATTSAFGINTLTTIGTNTVDVTNDTSGPGSSGYGAGPEVSAAKTNTVAPGATTRFQLEIANGSANADSFDLAASTVDTFVSLVIPTGWTVVFHDTNGAVITNTGVINAGAVRTVYADVTAPANAALGFDVYFRARSPTTGATDRLYNAIAVGIVRGLALSPNNTGQTGAGGTVVYVHTIVNNGNVLEGDGVASTVSLATTSSSGFTSVVHWDRNNDGTLDAGDPVVATLADLVGGSNGASPLAGLSIGESARLFVKVTSAPGSPNGASDTTTLTATLTGVISGIAAPASVSVTDTTTVIASQVTLQKLQAIDSTCDGSADTALSTAPIASGARPGACIRYSITATNAGSVEITSLVISDATPASTTYHAAVPAAASSGSVSVPSADTAGTIAATVGTLQPGVSATLTFGVRIDPL